MYNTGFQFIINTLQSESQIQHDVWLFFKLILFHVSFYNMFLIIASEQQTYSALSDGLKNQSHTVWLLSFAPEVEVLTMWNIQFWGDF